jgi:hypothetical protein
VEGILGDDAEALELLAEICEVMVVRRDLMARTADLIASRRGCHDRALTDLTDLSLRYYPATIGELRRS